MSKHAVYATTTQGVTFRIGQPTDWRTAQERWLRLYPDPVTTGYIKHMRRKYPVKFYEVRSTDRDGYGLGSERHSRAIPVPYRNHRKAGR
jgi:hypothetical protein